MSADYDLHASRLQNDAARAYQEWLASMTPEDRARMKELGLSDIPDDSTEVSGHSPWEISDIADTPHARTEIDLASAIDTPAEILADAHDLPLSKAQELIGWCKEQVADALRKHEAHLLQIVVGGLLSAKNPKLSAAGLAFAAGLSALNGLGSQTDFAKANHISRSAISKIVKAWQRALNLRVSAHQKSEHACTIYSKVGKEKHWRKRKVSAVDVAKRLQQKIAAA